MLTSLAVLGDTSLELSDTSGHNEHGSISLKKEIKVRGRKSEVLVSC
jgi:hypothetical protein